MANLESIQAQIDQLPDEDRHTLTADLIASTQPDERGLLPYSVFLAIGRKIGLSTVELLPFRANPGTGETQALLLQRPAKDGFSWEGKWHIPGTVVQAWRDEVPHDDDINFSDPTFNPIDAFEAPVNRLLQDEMKGGVRLTKGPYLWGARLRRGNRSLELTAMLHAGVEVVDPSQPLPAGRFFNLQDIVVSPPPEGLIVGHYWAIGKAAAAQAAQQL